MPTFHRNLDLLRVVHHTHQRNTTASLRKTLPQNVRYQPSSELAQVSLTLMHTDYAQYYADLARQEDGDEGDPLAGLEALDDGHNHPRDIKPFAQAEYDYEPSSQGKKRPREDDEFEEPEGDGGEIIPEESVTDAARANAPIVYGLCSTLISLMAANRQFVVSSPRGSSKLLRHH